MRKDELRIEIQKLMEHVPETMLEDIYKFLKEAANNSPESIKLSHNLNKILTEDTELLKRLAQ